MVLCGDWNFKPGDASYRFMTTGELDDADEAYPDYREYDPWRIEQGKRCGGWGIMRRTMCARVCGGEGHRWVPCQ